jgi:hypothetical protein
MSLLIFIIVVVIVLAIALYAIRMLPIQAPFNAILQALACLVAVLVIVNRAGLLS